MKSLTILSFSLKVLQPLMATAGGMWASLTSCYISDWLITLSVASDSISDWLISVSVAADSISDWLISVSVAADSISDWLTSVSVLAYSFLNGWFLYKLLLTLFLIGWFLFQLLLTVFSALCYAILVSLAAVIYKEGTNVQFWWVKMYYCKFRNFRKGFIFVKLRICEVSWK